MALRIVPFESQHNSAVQAFHNRLRAAGSLPFTLSEKAPQPTPAHIVQTAGVQFHHFVAVDDDGAVHGGYFVRTQKFVINGAVQTVGHYSSPLSEGIIDKRYATVGVQLLSHALKWQPLLFAMGMGGRDKPLPRILTAMNWTVLETPFYFHVLRGGRFLRNVGPLRRTAARRLAADLLALSGFGGLGIRIAQSLRSKRSFELGGITSQFEQFGTWTDQVWQKSASQYSFCAIRDTGYLQFTYPPLLQGRCRGFRATKNAGPTGWVQLLDCRPQNTSYFGSMKVMALADGVASAEAIPSLITTAVRTAKAEGADLLLSNQMHRDWKTALHNAGFWQGPSNYLLALSKPLAALVGPATDRIHFNRGDGDGLVNL